MPVLTNTRGACMVAMAWRVIDGGRRPHQPRAASQLARHVDGLKDTSQVGWALIWYFQIYFFMNVSKNPNFMK